MDFETIHRWLDSRPQDRIVRNGFDGYMLDDDHCELNSSSNVTVGQMRASVIGLIADEYSGECTLDSEPLTYTLMDYWDLDLWTPQERMVIEKEYTWDRGSWTKGKNEEIYWQDGKLMKETRTTEKLKWELPRET